VANKEQGSAIGFQKAYSQTTQAAPSHHRTLPTCLHSQQCRYLHSSTAGKLVSETQELTNKRRRTNL